MSRELEEGLELALDWQKLEKAVAGTKGIIPVAVQHADTREVILVAYINQQAFEESLKRRMLVLWSSSRQELWIKGATSGETFTLLEAYVNCEQNSLLFIVRPERGCGLKARRLRIPKMQCQPKMARRATVIIARSTSMHPHNSIT